MRLYVGNLPGDMTPQDLEDLFTPYGDVTSSRLLTTQRNGHPRGFGYIEMPGQHARRAIIELDGQRINFLVLQVSEAAC